MSQSSRSRSWPSAPQNSHVRSDAASAAATTAAIEAVTRVVSIRSEPYFCSMPSTRTALSLSPMPTGGRAVSSVSAWPTIASHPGCTSTIVSAVTIRGNWARQFRRRSALSPSHAVTAIPPSSTQRPRDLVGSSPRLVGSFCRLSSLLPRAHLDLQPKNKEPR